MEILRRRCAPAAQFVDRRIAEDEATREQVVIIETLPGATLTESS